MRGLPERTGPEGQVLPWDALRPQRLAAPVKVYVDHLSAHPLERDAGELYADPDGYLHADGSFSITPKDDSARPVMEIELEPEDGLYPLPYMAFQADGQPWEDDGAYPGAPAEKSRQSFFPDGSRSFEEIDRLGIDTHGMAGLISGKADIEFFRIMPPAGYSKGLEHDARSDSGTGDIRAESRGADYFAYRPYHLSVSPARPSLAALTNRVQAVADAEAHDGLLWTQGSPQIEETLYWFNLLIDTTRPICGCAAQRAQGEISADGPKNIVDSIAYLGSGAWADEAGRNRFGAVLLQEQQIFASREVAKVDARPGGYRALGGHGGVLGQISHRGKVWLPYAPTYRHTATSAVNIHRLPDSVPMVVGSGGDLKVRQITIRDGNGHLTEEAIPSVSVVKEGGYSEETFGLGPDDRPDMVARLEHKLSLGRLGGFVAEGLVPYGHQPAASVEALLRRAIFSGLPVVRVGRGAPEGYTDPAPFFLAGANLTATKARLLLMAVLMKFGALPPAADPDNPTETERARTQEAVSAMQEVFDTH